MASLRDMISRALLGNKVKQLEQATNLLIESYERQIIPTSQEAIAKQFSELDPRYIDFLVRQLETRSLSSVQTNETMRLRSVEESRSLYLWDVVTQNIIDLWTDFGFGLKIGITCEDEKANESFQEFWTARRNSPVIGDKVLKDRSKDELVDGEIYFVFFASKMDGLTTIRVIPTEEITEIISDPDDKYKVLYYKREYTSGELGAVSSTVYYRDWQAEAKDLERAHLPDNAVKADQANAQVGDDQTGTDVVMMHVGYRQIDGRGWPLMTAGAPWSRAYKNFLQDRAAVARLAAMYPEKIKVKGGQRVIDSIRATLESSLTQALSNGVESNPPAVAGSTWLENESLERTRQPVGTGASDAEKDGAPLLAQAGLAGRIFPHYLGRGEAYRLATATSMETPIFRAFNRYQQFWSSVFRDMVEVVLRFLEQYGGQDYSTYAARISTDAIVSVDIGQLAAVGNTLTQMAVNMVIPAKTAQAASIEILRVALQNSGVADVDNILNPDQEPIKSSELAESATDYWSSLRRAVYGLWSGKLYMADFTTWMMESIDAYLQRAWRDGMEAAGVDWEDRTQEELTALDAAIFEEYQHIDGFGQFILENSKAAGGKLGDVIPRMELWVNRYNDIYNRALMMAGKDLPLTWHLGATEKHCSSCSWANSKTYRASVWQKYGWRPQSPALECKGYQCDCSLSADGNKPLRGHPRMLAGEE